MNGKRKGKEKELIIKKAKEQIQLFTFAIAAGVKSSMSM